MKKGMLSLLAAFVGLLVVAYLVMLKPGERSVLPGAGRALVEIDSAAVEKIELRSPSSTIVLEKKGGEWFLQEPMAFKADGANVANLLQQVRAMTVKSIVSQQPEKHGMFQVDSTGTFVTLYEKGTKRASIVIGKMGPSFSDLYARLATSNEVALISGASSFVFSRPVKDWRDRTIFSAPKESITEVRFQYGDTTFTLQLRDSVWMIGADSTQSWSVESFLSSLSHVQADEFIDTPPTTIPKPTATLTIGATQLRFYFHKESGKYVVQSSANPQWYEIFSWRADQLLKRKKDFL
jgi:hypothetical protein